MTQLCLPSADSLMGRITGTTAKVGVIGMGYVGLPLAVAAWHAGFDVTGVDIDDSKVQALNAGKTYIGRIDDALVTEMVASGRFRATTDFSALRECDVIPICVPTPLNKYREPDLS